MHMIAVIQFTWIVNRHLSIQIHVHGSCLEYSDPNLNLSSPFTNTFHGSTNSFVAEKNCIFQPQSQRQPRYVPHICEMNKDTNTTTLVCSFRTQKSERTKHFKDLKPERHTIMLQIMFFYFKPGNFLSKFFPCFVQQALVVFCQGMEGRLLPRRSGQPVLASKISSKM